MKYQFCKCNKCGEVFIDINPDMQPFFEMPDGKWRSLLEASVKDSVFASSLGLLGSVFGVLTPIQRETAIGLVAYSGCQRAVVERVFQ